ncbi:MAG: hypothetical protein J0M12_15240 [Deltaproteobacteria bacterium]|nr:hypothetical protein [Deltaproteobacteria bacterium]
MRNGQNPELARSTPEARDSATSLDVSIKSSPEQQPTSPETTIDLEHHDLGASSFAFQVERSTEKSDTARRIQTFPKLEQEQVRELKSPTLSNSATHSTKATQASTSAARKAGLSPKSSRKGMNLLDRYISFLAKLLKALEKFIMRRFTRGQAEQQHTQEAKTEVETTEREQPKKKKPPVREGPGI